MGNVLPQERLLFGAHTWHFCTRNCTLNCVSFFSLPRDKFGSLVANLIIEKFIKFNKRVLVRVFLEGYLRETERVSGIKIISRLPWLRGMFCHRSACCLGHLREMAPFERSCQNSTTSACIGFFLKCYFHFIFESYTSQDTY